MSVHIRVALLFCTATCAFAQNSGVGNRVLPGTSATSYQAITAKERFQWFGINSFGPASMAGGVISAGWGTLFNLPHEYGTHWEGFGDRFGIRLTGVVTGNAMEAGLGALWGEDPRYPRDQDDSFGGRVGHVVKWAFLARDRNGNATPAYARYAATAGNNFLSNTWRERSESDTAHAVERTALGFAARMAGNAFKEFWPDVSTHVFHRNAPRSSGTTPSSDSH